MIQILGAKRVLTLAILVLANVILAAALYFVFIPQKIKTEQDLRVTKAAVASRRNEIQTMQTEYQQIEEQKSLFGDLEKAQFFSTQDRVEARRMIETIQGTSKVLSAKYAIGAAEVLENEQASAAGHVILHSPLNVKIDALDDIDIYSFIYWMENAFPGHAAVTGLTLERKLDIDEVTLRQIGNSVPTVLVNASIDFDWSTMVPRANLPQQLGPQPGLPQ